jgi:hypothetical protein
MRLPTRKHPGAKSFSNKGVERPNPEIQGGSRFENEDLKKSHIALLDSLGKSVLIS